MILLNPVVQCGSRTVLLRPHSMEKRKAGDGQPYTRDEFVQWYGVAAGPALWEEVEADDAGVAEHDAEGGGHRDERVDVETGGRGATENAALLVTHGVAGHGAEGLRLRDLAEEVQAGGIGATEHAGLALALPARILLAPEDLLALRVLPQGGHDAARRLLDQIANAPEEEPLDLSIAWEDWRVYIAKHKHSDEIVGPGVVALKAERIPNSSDPNRFGAKRLDFFVYRCDGTAVRLHPGLRKSSDAKIVVLPAKVLQNTLADLTLIPQGDRISSKDGFNRLLKVGPEDKDLTDGSTFPWPRLVANLSRLAPEVMGEGSIRKVVLAHVDAESIVLEFTRSDETLVQLRMVTYETQHGPKVKASVIRQRGDGVVA